MDKREGEVSRFPSKLFCLTVPKNAVGEPFSLSLISGIEKFWMRGWGRGGERHDFPPKIFCLTVPKKIVGEPFRVSLISGFEKFYASEGYVTIFGRKIFVSQHRKTLQGNPSVLCFGKFPVANNFLNEKGGV